MQPSPALLVESLHSAPPALAWCDPSLAIAFRTDSWQRQFDPGSEHVELANNGEGRVVGQAPTGERVEYKLTASPADSGFWLQLSVQDATQAQLLALKQQVAQLEQHAFRDTLTGLWNRRFFDRTVDSEMVRAERHGQPLSLLLIDVDHFKHVNDQHGHAVGDQVLRAVAEVLSERCRAGERVVRWGGDEFAVLATYCGCRAAAALAEQLRSQVDQTAMPGGVHVTLSIGGAQFLPGETHAAWFERADAQVYAAKQAGRNAAKVDLASPAASANGVVELVWRDEYFSGNAQIDREHVELFALGNKVLDAGLRAETVGLEAAGLVAALDRLLAHVVTHFTNEESVLQAKRYPHANAHGRAHGRLIEHALALRSEVVNGHAQFGALADFLAREVVIKHMVQTDRDFYPWVADRPVR